jgi:ATP-dependent DNA ligase
MRCRLALRRGQDPARGLGWAWEDVLARGYEGLAAKDSASPYVGARTLKWLKVKQPKYREGERGWETGES